MVEIAHDSDNMPEPMTVVMMCAVAVMVLPVNNQHGVKATNGD